MVVSTTPDTFAVLPDFSGSIRFDFDERISEQVDGGALDDAVVVSPRLGDVRVRHERRSLVIDVDGGFEPDRVYRVTLLPVVRDLFNNQMRDQFELVFSTGPTPVPHDDCGDPSGTGSPDRAWRTTRSARWRQNGDSYVHLTMTDTDGVFGLRFMPTAIEVDGRRAGRLPTHGVRRPESRRHRGPDGGSGCAAAAGPRGRHALSGHPRAPAGHHACPAHQCHGYRFDHRAHRVRRLPGSGLSARRRDGHGAR